MPILEIELVGEPEPADRSGLAQRIADAAAEALAGACRRPAGNVHVRLEPPGAGRQAFGGTLV